MKVVTKEEVSVHNNEGVNPNAYNRVKTVVDYFNGKMLMHDFFRRKKDDKFTDEIVIDLCECKQMSLDIYDKAVEIINQKGWEARHEFWYSTNIAAPSWGIFVQFPQ